MNEGHAHHNMAEAFAGSVDVFSAWWGGFSSFFTLWFFCLLQISPFFLAFMTACGALSNKGDGNLRDRLGRMIMPALLCSAGYIVFFSILGSTASSTGILLMRYNSLLGQLGGIFTLLFGAWFMGGLRLPRLSDTVVVNVGGLLLGCALAANYRPCATPTLSFIYNLTQSPASVGTGSRYLAVYAVGVSMAILLVGFALSAALFSTGRAGVMKWTRIVSGLLLLVFGILVVTDLMVIYKGLLVGGFT